MTKETGLAGPCGTARADEGDQAGGAWAGPWKDGG